MRRAVELLTERVDRRPLQGAPILPAALMGEERAHPLAVEPVAEAEPAQDTHRVGPHVDAAADLRQLRRLLVDVDLEPGSMQRQGGSEAADAAADDRDPELPAQWLFAACQRSSASCGFEIAGSMISPCLPVLAVNSMT